MNVYCDDLNSKDGVDMNNQLSPATLTAFLLYHDYLVQLQNYIPSFIAYDTSINRLSKNDIIFQNLPVIPENSAFKHTNKQILVQVDDDRNNLKASLIVIKFVLHNNSTNEVSNSQLSTQITIPFAINCKVYNIQA